MRNQLLRDTDWASMAHSLEVRVPLVDSVLLRAVSGVRNAAPSLVNQGALAESVSIPLPSAIRERAKSGFTTPIAKWLNHARAMVATKAPRRKMAESAHWSREWAERLATV
jgi:asparagine synthase (glutamine-hydrolysing)